MQSTRGGVFEAVDRANGANDADYQNDGKQETEELQLERVEAVYRCRYHTNDEANYSSNHEQRCCNINEGSLERVGSIHRNDRD